MDGIIPPFWKADVESGFAVLQLERRETFYHNLSIEEGSYWVSKLKKESVKALAEGGKHTYAGWQDDPVWYLAATDDKALPVEAQRMIVQMAKDAGTDVTLREIETSHSPMLSQPRQTVDFIIEAVKAFANNHESSG